MATNLENRVNALEKVLSPTVVEKPDIRIRFVAPGQNPDTSPEYELTAKGLVKVLHCYEEDALL